MRNNKAQLLVIAGVVMAVSVIALGAVSVRLSNINISIENRSSDLIITEYRLVREKFGIALEDVLEDEFEKENLDPVNLNSLFEFTTNIFHFFEMNHNYVFDARAVTKEGVELDSNDFTDSIFERNNEPDGMYVKLYLSDGEDMISEIVKYYI